MGFPFCRSGLSKISCLNTSLPHLSICGESFDSYFPPFMQFWFFLDDFHSPRAQSIIQSEKIYFSIITKPIHSFFVQRSPKQRPRLMATSFARFIHQIRIHISNHPSFISFHVPYSFSFHDHHNSDHFFHNLFYLDLILDFSHPFSPHPYLYPYTDPYS